MGRNFDDYPGFQPKQHLRKDMQHAQCIWAGFGLSGRAHDFLVVFKAILSSILNSSIFLF